MKSEGDFHIDKNSTISRATQSYEIKKNNSAKKAIIAGVIIIGLLTIIFFSGALNNLGIQDLSPSSVKLPITITGRVIEGSNGTISGESISGVEIKVINSKGYEVITDKTNVTGDFFFDNLPPDSYNISITVPNGYINRSATSYLVSYSHYLEFKLQNMLSNPKTMNYHYTLRGVSSEIVFTVYEGMYNYLVDSENSSVSYVGQQPSSEEISRIVTLRYINESVEQDALQNLANAIKQSTPNEDDQARIAINLVQNIPYDWSSFNANSTDWKYPYEVLYTNTGVCEQKSMLLVCLLRDLGYGCSILEFTSLNHAAVGLKCPTQYAYYSGYAFVESTSPSIITDVYETYVDGSKLPPNPDYIIVVQDGKVMYSVSEEFQDAQTYLALLNMGPVLDQSHYAQWQAIVTKYGIFTS